MKKILSILLLLIAIPSQAEIISRNLIGTAADIIIIQNYQAVPAMWYQLLTRFFILDTPCYYVLRQ